MRCYIFIVSVFLLFTFYSAGQISIPSSTIVTENFNSIGSSGTAALPANWKMSSAGNGSTANWTTGTNITSTTQSANSGTPAAGGAYNWATGTGTDRAIGFLTSGSYAAPNSIMAYYRNTTGGTVTSITVSFAIERYRINTSAFSLSFFSSTDGNNWTARSGGDVSAGALTAGSSSYTFTTPQTVLRTVTISGLSIANNGDFYLRWLFSDAVAVSAQGTALDNVSLYAGSATPVVSAKLLDLLTVDNPPINQANPGDQLTYSTTIKNTGSGDAGNVALTIPAPANTTLIGGSVTTSALARDESYTTAYNTVLSGNNVLTNDFGLPSPVVVSFGPSDNAAATAAGGTGSSDNGGTVVVNSNGTFTYTPAAGFAGIDRFSYRAATGTLPDNDAAVTITVGSKATSSNDAYNVTGNISIAHAAGAGLLSNDAGTAVTVTAVNGNAANVGIATATTQNGSVTVNSDGSFSYNPPAGYEGADNFTYTIDNGFGIPSTATVNFTVSGMIWFINNAAGSAGDGRLSTPFNTLAAFAAVNNGTGNNPAAGDNIFIYTGAGNYTGGISLLNNQRLTGQGASASIAAITGITPASGSAALPATGGANPVISNAAGNGITVASGNTIRGTDIGNCSGNALNGSLFGTLMVTETSITTTGQGISLTNGTLNAAFPSISSSGGSSAIFLSGVAGSTTIGAGTCSGHTGASFSITGGTISVTYSGNITQANNAALVSVSGGHATGTVTFNTGTLSATNGTGLQFDNADGIYNFNGAVLLNGGDAGIDIINGSGGNFSFLNAPVTNPSGVALLINGGGGSISHTGAISKSSAGRLIDIQSRTGGSVTISSNLSSTVSSSGINISNCTGGTVSFTGSSKTLNTPGNNPVNLAANTGAIINFTGGGLAITSTTATGFNATGGGTVSVQGTGNIITSTTGTALNVVNTTIGSGNLNFQSISSAGGTATGIILDNTGSSGGLIVSGDGSSTSMGGNSSGGIISGKSGADGSTSNGIGIYLNNTSNVVLRRITINGVNQNFGVRGISVTNFTFEYCTIGGTNGNNDAFDEAAMRFDNLLGSGTVNACNISGGIESNFRVINNTGTLNYLQVSNSTIHSNSLVTGGDGFFAQAQNGAVMVVKVISCTFHTNRDDHIQTDADGASSMTSVITGNLLTSNGTIGSVPLASTLGGAITVAAGGLFSNSTSFFTIDGNNITGAKTAPVTVNIVSSLASGLLSGTISNNILGKAGAANSGSSSSDGISILVNGAGTLNVNVTNNTIRQFNNIGIQLIKRDGTGNLNATVTGNNIAEPVAPNALQGILVTSGATSGPPPDAGTVCVHIGGNTVTGPNFGGDLIRIRQRFSTVVRLPGYAGSLTDMTAIANFIIGQNIITNESPNAKASATTQAPGSYQAGAACTSGANPN